MYSRGIESDIVDAVKEICFTYSARVIAQTVDKFIIRLIMSTRLFVRCIKNVAFWNWILANQSRLILKANNNYLCYDDFTLIIDGWRVTFQVRQLLHVLERTRMAESGEVDANDDLFLFRSIEDLQTKNQQLMSALREAEAKREEMIQAAHDAEYGFLSFVI